MRSLMLLCAFCLFAILQAEHCDRDKMKNYYKCWTYMNCISDGPMARKMESCLDLLKPGDLQFYVNYIDENYYKFQNHTEPAALSEYCNKDGDEQRDLYDKIIDAFQSLEKLVCAQPDKADMCSRGRDCIDCVFLYLEENCLDDACKID